MKDNQASDRRRRLTDAALEEALRTTDSAAVPRRSGTWADQLHPLLEVALALRRMYADVPEPPGGLVAGRRRMLTEADHLLHHIARNQAVSPPIPVRFGRSRVSTVFAGKLLGLVLACAVGIAALGVGGVAAAVESLPGSVLYPAKVALEGLRLELAPSPEGRVALALAYADARIAEIGALKEQNDDAAEMAVTRMQSHLRYAMDLAAQAPAEDVPALLEQIMLRTRAQVRALQQLQAQVQQRNRVQVEQALRICQQANKEASNGLLEPQVFRSRHQERAGMPDDDLPPVPPSVEPGQDGVGAEALQEQQHSQQQERQQEQRPTEQPQQHHNQQGQQVQQQEPQHAQQSEQQVAGQEQQAQQDMRSQDGARGR